MTVKEFTESNGYNIKTVLEHWRGIEPRRALHCEADHINDELQHTLTYIMSLKS